MLSTTGQNLLGQGQQASQSANNLFNPLIQRNERLLSGDQSALRFEMQPEIDAIGQQFANVRNMIADQPRSGAKASTAAQLPIHEIQTLAHLMSEGRRGAADQQSDIAARKLGAAQNEQALGLQGLTAGGGLLASKGNQDIARRGQNIDLGSKIAETIAELGFLLKGSGERKMSVPGTAGPSINPGSFPIGGQAGMGSSGQLINRFPNPWEIPGSSPATTILGGY